ncbi:glutamate-cysteine ligase family protein [Actinopolymorpha sp. B11F2]|uniref:glutamate-cysteine ligase family protein n=1 Tax=Actinopolymorpha sp. B11F2 TaxID=3160862 RepID=UPI0032E3A0E0
MNGSTQVASCDAVHGYVAAICFKTGPPVTVGAELEWCVIDATDPTRVIPLDRLRNILDQAGPTPGGSTVTYEPGGQLELSSPPAFGVTACWQGLRADISHIERILADDGLTLLWTGIDPYRPPVRQISDLRYDAMEAYFDRRGPEGRLMMCSTAAVQVNLDAGTDAADIARRWRLLHAVGPPLVAAFANSSWHAGRSAGCRSMRQVVWQRIDPGRTRPPVGPDPVTAWADYALDAGVMVRRGGPDQWVTNPGHTFRQWLTGRNGNGHASNGHGSVSGSGIASGNGNGSGNGRVSGTSNGHVRAAPTIDDLDYHLTTLFPPVRPRGWFEVRYIDAQPAAYWPVPVAVLSALVNTPRAGDEVMAAAEPVADAWWDAAHRGLAHPGLFRAATACFETAIDSLRADGTDTALVALVESYLDRYVARRRCPADDAHPFALAPAKEFR